MCSNHRRVKDIKANRQIVAATPFLLSQSSSHPSPGSSRRCLQHLSSQEAPTHKSSNQVSILAVMSFRAAHKYFS